MNHGKASDAAQNFGFFTEDLKQSSRRIRRLANSLFPTLKSLRRDVEHFGEHSLRHGGLSPHACECLSIDLRRRIRDRDRSECQFAFGMSDAFVESLFQSLEQRLSVSRLHDVFPFFPVCFCFCNDATASIRSSSHSSLRSFFSSFERSSFSSLP